MKMKKTNTPSPNGDNGTLSPNGDGNRDNGRGPDGRFAKGNPGGPGNPHARRIGEIRARLLAAVTDEDLESIIRTLIEKAKAGEPWAVKELLSRLIGDALISEPDPEPNWSELLAEELR